MTPAPSQGQQRSLVLSLKLGEAGIAQKIGGEYPVILLDDVFSELDENRRRYILEALSEGEDGPRQIIVTSCEPDVIPDSEGRTAPEKRPELDEIPGSDAVPEPEPGERPEPDGRPEPDERPGNGAARARFIHVSGGEVLSC